MDDKTVNGDLLLMEFSNALQQFSKGLNRMLIIQKVQMKYLPNFVDQLVQNAKKLDDYRIYRENLKRKELNGN